MSRKKVKIIINNRLKGSLGASEFVGKGRPTDMKATGRIHINIKAHKGDKANLASTIKHELMHVKHPKMTEKEVYKRTAKTKISEKEQSKLLQHLRNKKLNYKTGALKRKFKMNKNEKVEPGTFINKARGLAVKGLI